MGSVPDAAESRSARLAGQYEAAHEAFTRLVESLTESQWGLIGKNHPKRMNDEDEGRPLGVIAHHVAVSSGLIVDRIQLLLEGRPLPTADFKTLNARHAAEQAGVGREEVLDLLRESGPRLATVVRAIPDDQLDPPRDTPIGPMSIAQRVELVLIGHIQSHRGSIEATIAQG